MTISQGFTPIPARAPRLHWVARLALAITKAVVVTVVLCVILLAFIGWLGSKAP